MIRNLFWQLRIAGVTGGTAFQRILHHHPTTPRTPISIRLPPTHKRHRRSPQHLRPTHNLGIRHNPGKVKRSQHHDHTRHTRRPRNRWIHRRNRLPHTPQPASRLLRPRTPARQPHRYTKTRQPQHAHQHNVPHPTTVRAKGPRCHSLGRSPRSQIQSKKPARPTTPHRSNPTTRRAPRPSMAGRKRKGLPFTNRCRLPELSSPKHPPKHYKPNHQNHLHPKLCWHDRPPQLPTMKSGQQTPKHAPPLSPFNGIFFP